PDDIPNPQIVAERRGRGASEERASGFTTATGIECARGAARELRVFESAVEEGEIERLRYSNKRTVLEGTKSERQGGL
ncbi:hypothetical protein BHE74_00056575, partial [Ensete ventricosum]